MIVKCPRCGKEMETAGNPFRPFCSERCKLVDLGNWLSGTYKIPEKPMDEREDETPHARKDVNEE
jgi:endogenous inhibitor of DNA gyrase (YacG/DUF329 family)